MRTAAALSFLDYSATESDVDKIVARFLETILVFGFEVSAGGGWVGAGASRVHRFYFNSWPTDWLEQYGANSYFESDPVTIEARRRMTPFLASEMVNERSFTLEGKLVLDAVRAYGWTTVLCVPIHGPAGYQGLVSLASLNAVPVTGLDRNLLRAMALAAHDRAHGAVGNVLATQPQMQLTPREIDCMRWVAAGKTDAEIAVILGIAAATAHFHIEHVKRKANTRSRSEAIARLVLAGMI